MAKVRYQRTAVTVQSSSARGLFYDNDVMYLCDGDTDTIRLFNTPLFPAIWDDELSNDLDHTLTDVCVVNGNIFASSAERITKFVGSSSSFFNTPDKYFRAINKYSILIYAYGDNLVYVDGIACTYDHNVVLYDEDFSERLSFGGFGKTGAGLNCPEGIIQYNNEFYVADTGNKRIAVFNNSGVYQREYKNNQFSQPSDVLKVENGFLVADPDVNSVFVFDDKFVLIDKIDGLNFFANRLCLVDDGFAISTDIGCSVYSLSIESDLRFTELLNKVTRTLYPTGRMFNMPENSIIEKFHTGLNLSMSRLLTYITDINARRYPDNEGFDLDAIENWERVYGIVSKANVSVDDRRNVLIQRFNYPNGIYSRQSAEFIQEQLHLAGFDEVYVTYDPGEPISGWTDICANFIDSEHDLDYLSRYYTPFDNSTCASDDTCSQNLPIDYELEQKGYLWIHGQYGRYSFGSVNEYQKDEFRELLLILKPATIVCFNNVNYT